MRLFFSEGCPYAHRSRALLTHLGQPFEGREIDLEAKAADFLALSPTGAVPMLEDDGFLLYESAVINEYLAERFTWADAFSPNLQQRARERLAMKRIDDVLVPLFFRALKDGAALDATPNWQREVEQLGITAAHAKPVSLLGFHVATHWLRFNWVAPQAPLVLALEKAAGAFLAQAVSHQAIVKTSPDRETTTRTLRERFGPKAA
jgi:Glutathione S-transferase, N-terminal domain